MVAFWGAFLDSPGPCLNCYNFLAIWSWAMSKDSTESYGSGDSDSFRFVCDRCAAGGDIFDLVKKLVFPPCFFALSVHTQYVQKLSEMMTILRFFQKI